MIKTIKELLIEWWAESATTKLPLLTIYTCYVEVDGKTIHIESMTGCKLSARRGGDTPMPSIFELFITE